MLLEKNLEINPDKLTPEQRSKLKEVFKKMPPGIRILNRETSEQLQELSKYKESGKSDDSKILKFFEGEIPESDLEALKYSLYLRTRFNMKLDISKLKEDIREKFGQRGNTISNLCTAGYFDGFLSLLYQEAGKDKFLKLYEAIVTNSVLAVFVYHGMSDLDLKRKIEEEIETSRKYGLKLVHIHGIGKANKNKIEKLFDEEEDFLIRRLRIPQFSSRR